MSNASRFEFFKSHHVPTLTVLKAAIEDFSYAPHAHEEYAFGVTLAGRQDFFSGGQFHRSPPGNVILFNPEEVHDGHSGGERALDYLMVYAHPEQVKPLFADALGHTRGADFRSHQTLIQDAPLRQAIVELARLVTSQVGSCIDQENALYRVVERTAQLGGHAQPSQVTHRPDALLGLAREYIHAHLEADMSLDDISQAAHLSKYHFLRLFRQHFGMTPHQYVMNGRVNAARAALDQGTSLTEVALRHGLSLVMWGFGLAMLAAGAPGSYVVMGSLVGQRIKNPAVVRRFNGLMAGLLVAVAFSIGFEHVWLPLTSSAS